VAPPSLRGRNVRLRPLRRSDIPALDRIRSDRRVTRYLPPRVRTEGGAKFVTRVLAKDRRGEGRSFVICRAGSTDVLGQIRPFAWSHPERRAEVGYFLRRDCWGHALAPEALRLVCSYGFRSMAIHRIEATIVVGNHRSGRVLEKVGFRPEGRRRRAARLAGRWADEAIFGLLRPELRDGT